MELAFDLENIFDQFEADGGFSGASELGTGHINDTYLIRTAGSGDYVLQRINHKVFPDVPGLVNNKVLISNHLREKLSFLPGGELQKRVLTFLPTKSGANFYVDHDGNHWNLTAHIDGSVSYERVTRKNIAYGAGRLFGEFLHLTTDFDASKLIDVIPDFHKMSVRFSQFDAALSAADKERIEKASELISFAQIHRSEMLTLENLINEGKIAIRATHNDTKISNALFTADDKPLCVIDTDTVMKGIILFDFGDAVRTICNTADEDEADISKVEFELSYFEGFANGFLEAFDGEITDAEAENLAFSAKVMTFIIGLRMLTDYLKNDIYFKTAYESHNLDRAKNQFKLVKEIDRNLDKMNRIIFGLRSQHGKK
ncbi:MAG: phosphotransferase [Pyrinomonadaceae bacterium]